MANRRYKRPQAIYEEEMSPEEKYGTSRFFEASIRAKPELQSSFDYYSSYNYYPIKRKNNQQEKTLQNQEPILKHLGKM